MRALDLFCGGGGAAAGIIDAGFEVVGVDSNRNCRKTYPGAFIHADVFTLDPAFLRGFDFVWASPPCQKWSVAANAHRKRNGGSKHVDLVGPVRDLLIQSGVRAWVIENVPLAPIRPDVVLTGPQVGLSRILRKRHFEISPWCRKNTLIVVPPPGKRAPVEHRVAVTKKMCCSTHYYRRKEQGLSGYLPVAEAREVMGIEHSMTGYQVGEAVPPPMALLIAEQIADSLQRIR